MSDFTGHHEERYYATATITMTLRESEALARWVTGNTVVGDEALVRGILTRLNDNVRPVRGNWEGK